MTYKTKLLHMELICSALLKHNHAVDWQAHMKSRTQGVVLAGDGRRLEFCIVGATCVLDLECRVSMTVNRVILFDEAEQISYMYSNFILQKIISLIMEYVVW